LFQELGKLEEVTKLAISWYEKYLIKKEKYSFKK
jgi:hypothetical protein